MNTICHTLKLIFFEASHNPFIGCVLDGIPARYLINEDIILEDLELRKPASGIGQREQNRICRQFLDCVTE